MSTEATATARSTFPGRSPPVTISDTSNASPASNPYQRGEPPREMATAIDTSTAIGSTVSTKNRLSTTT